MIPQERRHAIADIGTIQPGDKRETATKIGAELPDHVARKAPSSSPDNFGAPSKNLRYETIEGSPQERSGALKRLSRMDTDLNPGRANIQGAGLHNLYN